MPLVWTFSILVVLLIFFREIIQKWSKLSKWNKILCALPGPPRWPVLGHLHLFAFLQDHEYLGTMVKFGSKFRDVGCFVISLMDFGPKMGVLTNAESVSNDSIAPLDTCFVNLVKGNCIAIIRFMKFQKVLLSTDHLEKGYGYPMIAEYLGDGIVTSKPEKWKHRRRMITPALAFKMFPNFIKIFNEQSVIMMQLLHDKFDHIENEDEGFQDISNFFTRCSFDIIMEAAMGTKGEAQTNKLSKFHHAMESGVRGIFTRLCKPWYRAKWLYWKLPEGRRMAKLVKYCHDFATNVIQQKIKEREEGTDEYSDGPKTFLDILLDVADNDKSLTFEGILEETLTVGGAGHDTVGTALNFVLFMLATHPHHQQEVQKELDAIFSGNKNKGYISLTDLSQMKYLERCVLETLRLYPAVSAFMRKLQSDLHLDNGIVMPKRLEVWIIPSILHKDPKPFPQPEKFDPDRFLPENCVGRHPCAFIPFSAGARNCIGQKFALLEIKLLLASVLSEFTVRTIDNEQDLKLIPSITLILVNPIRMKLIPRVNSSLQKNDNIST